MTHLLVAVSWTDPSVWLVLAAIVLIWFSISRSQRRWGRNSSRKIETNDLESDRPREPSPHVHSTLNQWEVQMHELAREIEGRINSKVRLLEQFIQEADRAASRLESALRAAEQIRKTQAAGMLPGLSGSAPAAGFDDSSNTRTHPRTIDETPEPHAEPDTGEMGDPSHPASHPSLSPAPEDSPDKGHHRRSIEEIYTLSDYGYSIEEIAQRTATPIGQVQLILSLRRSRPSSEGDD